MTQFSEYSVLNITNAELCPSNVCVSKVEYINLGSSGLLQLYSVLSTESQLDQAEVAGTLQMIVQIHCMKRSPTQVLLDHSPGQLPPRSLHSARTE